MATIIFKKEFEKKLKELRIKTKFVANIKRSCITDNELLSHRLEILNNQETWVDFIGSGFIWDITPEGIEYWISIILK